MVARAAMAGVPLLNGFISKEMFFTEAVFVNAAPWFDTPAAAWPRWWPASSAWPIRCASPSTCSSAPTPATRCRARRTSRRTGCGCRSSCWCWPACWWACCRSGPSRTSCPPRPRRWWAGSCPTSTSRCGTASTCRCAMSFRGAGRRHRALCCCCANRCRPVASNAPRCSAG